MITRSRGQAKLISPCPRSKYFMELLLVLFKSGLPDEEQAAIVDARAEPYRRVPGLILKFDVHDHQSNHIGAVFVFDSPANLETFKDSDLAQSISQVYQVTEPPTLRRLAITRALITNTAMTLHE